MAGSSSPGARRAAYLALLNEKAPPFGKVTWERSVPFGRALSVESFRLENGLRVLVCEDRSAPVVAYHTWYRVGSRHEKEGKTGLAHLFEHLMFNETENLGAGELDRKLEEAGAESNAATWLDWTQYNIAVPKDRLPLVAKLESERMQRLVLRDPQVASEKEVVANERRYRVDDDVEGAVSELLWATAFKSHAYKWPTIGWMPDIEGFTTEDCRVFYDTFYAPNNATIVVVGDVPEKRVLELVVKEYGSIEPSVLPDEDVRPEPPQREERVVHVNKPATTEKLVVGYHAPALGDFDHPALSLLTEVLFGGRASRIYRKMVRELELAVDVSGSVGPFHDPGLFEIYVSVREGKTAAEALAVLDAELDRLQESPVLASELERAKARTELSLLAGLDTVDGKASTIGFYDTVLGRPAGAFEKLETTLALTPSDLLRVARRYLGRDNRSVLFVHPEKGHAGAAA
ncbi:MAG TPA: pitrilysin family protein [Polyangiaceae bacterium]|nr:pitrilysin family protein [Polyangiaceae bacterium]